MKISLVLKLILIFTLLVFGFVYFPVSSLEIDKLEPFDLTGSHFSLIEASHNLYRPFPKMITRSSNPMTPEKTELGHATELTSLIKLQSAVHVQDLTGNKS